MLNTLTTRKTILYKDIISYFQSLGWYHDDRAWISCNRRQKNIFLALCGPVKTDRTGLELNERQDSPRQVGIDKSLRSSRTPKRPAGRGFRVKERLSIFLAERTQKRDFLAMERLTLAEPNGFRETKPILEQSLRNRPDRNLRQDFASGQNSGPPTIAKNIEFKRDRGPRNFLERTGERLSAFGGTNPKSGA